MVKNILIYVIVLVVVALGIWLFIRKGNTQSALYSTSPSPTASASATPEMTATPVVTPTPVASPAGKVVKLADGLQYQDEVIGTGAAAKAGDTVTVQYVGTLTNGQQFDSSYARSQAFTFQLGVGQVIKGWDEGVAGMKAGGKRKLQIPPALGYGAQGAGNVIPPNATLLFEVELVSIGK